MSTAWISHTSEYHNIISYNTKQYICMYLYSLIYIYILCNFHRLWFNPWDLSENLFVSIRRLSLTEVGNNYLVMSSSYVFSIMINEYLIFALCSLNKHFNYFQKITDNYENNFKLKYNEYYIFYNDAYIYYMQYTAYWCYNFSK